MPVRSPFAAVTRHLAWLIGRVRPAVRRAYGPMRPHAERVWETVGPAMQRGWDTTSPVVHRAWKQAGRPAAQQAFRISSSVSGLGWTVLGISVGSWFAGWRFGWVELMLVATAALVLFVACALLTYGRTDLQVHVEVDPLRVTAGTPAAGQVDVANVRRGVLLPIALELPIGDDAARFTLPLLRSKQRHQELFVVPTEYRGVFPIGPATTVRGDPLGLVRRTVAWTDAVELFVHPVTVPLEPMGAGLLRDLEGQTTNDVSMSDLAFHTLRDYTPGDDRRYIHWRSSAKAGRFLVRQFLDTRRSHVTTVVDSAVASYANPEDDYETAISVAASLAIRAVRDEQEVTVVAGDHAAPTASGLRVLDTFSRAEPCERGLGELSGRAARLAPDTSIALLVTGANLGHVDLQRAATRFAPEVKVVAVRIDPSRPTSIVGSRGMTVLTLQTLAELPALLAGALT